MARQQPREPWYRQLRWRAAAAAMVVFVVAANGIGMRLHAQAALQQQADQQAVPNVMLIEAKSGPATQDIVLPGTVQANYNTPVYARTSGYLKAWYTDIGTPVKQGQLLAEIDTPEVDDQLHQAEADLATAVANNELARTTAQRWVSLLKTQSVSAQETDEKLGDAKAKAAAVQASQANVARLRQQEVFKRIVAPFDGVVTAREIDVGALINAGGGQGPELFRVADKTKLRIYIQVPQSYAAAVVAGLKVSLSFPEHPGRVFQATLVRTSGALDPAARSLQVELQADNASNELLPGGYTEVHLTLPSEGNSVRIPVSALLFRAEGLRVATVDGDGRAQLHEIAIGHDFGQEVEIVTGLKPGDKVISNPPDSLVADETVHVVQPQPNGSGGATPDGNKDHNS